MDPLAGSSWSALGTVAGFARSPPNEVLMRFALGELERLRTGRGLDLGCGAGRNAVPLARAGFEVVETDLSWSMLSRNTLPAAAQPVAGEPFVFTDFSGQPQCFLTESQLVSELLGVGFALDATVPLTEYNRPRPGALSTGRVPVIYEAAFRNRLAR